MTLTQMQYFDTLCRYENYTRAAQEVFGYYPLISASMAYAVLSGQPSCQ